MIERLSDKNVNIIVALLVIGLFSFVNMGAIISIAKHSYIIDANTKQTPKEEVKEEENNELKPLTRNLSSNELLMDSLVKTLVASYSEPETKYNELSSEQVFSMITNMMYRNKKYTKIATDDVGAVYLFINSHIREYAYKYFNRSDFLYITSNTDFKYDYTNVGFTTHLKNMVENKDEYILLDINYTNNRIYFSYYGVTNKKSYVVTLLQENNVYRIIDLVVA